MRLLIIWNKEKMINDRYIFTEEVMGENGLFERRQFYVVEEKEVIEELERSGILEEQNLSVKHDAEDEKRSVMYIVFGRRFSIQRRIILTWIGEKTEEEFNDMIKMIEGSFVRV